MAVRTITITTDAYRNLARLKREGESFTELINRITAGTSPLDLVGVLSDVPLDRLEGAIRGSRRASRARARRVARGMAT